MRSSVSKREKKLIIFTILVAILGVLYAFIVEPLYKKYININQEIKIKQVRLAKNLKLMREKDAITEDFKRYDQRLKKTTSREEEMASVLSEIENIGKTAGVYLSDVKPQRTKDMAFYRMLLVEIKFQATMQTISKFIYELQNSPSLLKVKRLQINIKGGGSDLIEGTLQINKVALS